MIESGSMASGPPTLRLSERDNVLIARADLLPGVAGSPTVVDAVPRGHKFARVAIARDEPILKYGQVIGFAGRDIRAGEHLHTHNVEYREFDRTVAAGSATRPTAYVPVPERATFRGYVRGDGRVGTRNEIVIVVSVNCSATAATKIATHFELAGELDAYPDVDGVVALTHSYGCGTAGRGNAGFDLLQRTIMGYADHPNVGGVLMLGLGCEVNQLSILRDWGISADKAVDAMTIQEIGGTRRTVEAGIAAIRAMLPVVDAWKRQEVPVSELVLAMECGGSDGYSGITANPALGAAADLLIEHGGTAVFGETTEIYGGEHLLTQRAVSQEVADRLVERVRWWERRVQADGTSIDDNPSPGNKAGGLTTILEKSLGAIAKGGTTNLCDVVGYADRVTSKGLVFMDTPAYDPVNATGLVAGGAQLLAFTTGRGSAFGCKPVPSMKIATNSVTYHHMLDDMDFNCGPIVEEGVPVRESGRQIFDQLLRIASGERTKSEELGYGDHEFAPWQIATTL
ncbi:MAG: altronate dehydratase family protein [Lapillicoccus sp.]